MTQAELDALPEDGTFTVVEEMHDGTLERVPKVHTVGVLWVENDDDPVSVVDVHGQRWMVGLGSDGVKYKRRLR